MNESGDGTEPGVGSVDGSAPGPVSNPVSMNESGDGTGPGVGSVDGSAPGPVSNPVSMNESGDGTGPGVGSVDGSAPGPVSNPVSMNESGDGTEPGVGARRHVTATSGLSRRVDSPSGTRLRSVCHSDQRKHRSAGETGVAGSFPPGMSQRPADCPAESIHLRGDAFVRYVTATSGNIFLADGAARWPLSGQQASDPRGNSGCALPRRSCPRSPGRRTRPGGTARCCHRTCSRTRAGRRRGAGRRCPC